MATNGVRLPGEPASSPWQLTQAIHARYETLPRFAADLARLTPEQRRQFRRTVATFVEDLRTGGRFRAGLRVKRVQRAPGIYELTWSMGTGLAGRATWSYGPEQKHGAHIVWRRIGTHDILTGP